PQIGGVCRFGLRRDVRTVFEYAGQGETGYALYLAPLVILQQRSCQGFASDAELSAYCLTQLSQSVRLHLRCVLFAKHVEIPDALRFRFGDIQLLKFLELLFAETLLDSLGSPW